MALDNASSPSFTIPSQRDHRHAIEQGREELCDKPGSPVEPRYDGDFTHNTGRLKNLSAPDDILFALSLVIPTAIGFYQAWRSGLKMSLDEYVMGQRRMGSIPVGCSLTASFMSAVTMLGAPAEVYEHNTMYFWVCLSFLGVGALAAHVYIPVFFQLKLNTAYQVHNYSGKKGSFCFLMMGFLLRTCNID